MFPDSFLTEIKQELETRLARVGTEIKKLEKEGLESREPSSEIIDRASSDYTNLEGGAKIESLKAQKEAVEMTLQKMGTGKFGLCEKCGREIDKSRLSVVPTAKLCMDCKVICDNCGVEIEEARILGTKPPLVCQNCEEEVEPETFYTSSSIIPK